jgi:acrylyl-CoA reductase (NADPH)
MATRDHNKLVLFFYFRQTKYTTVRRAKLQQSVRGAQRMFKALLLEESNGQVTATVRDLDDSTLPAGNVSVAVEFTTINYKDGLVINGGAGLVKRWPHVPGIDFAGTVRESKHPDYAPGDKVVLTGWRVGETHWGGHAQRASVNGDHLVPLPPCFSTRQAMAIGTAGLTAMLAVMTLEAHGLTRESGEVLVTGAAGGVGSVATALLAARGYRVVASTGRPDAHEYLTGLGAATVIDRAPFADASKRPLESERWAGCVDAVGGNTLARVLAQTKYGGSVAAVGLVGGGKLEHTVIPFLLRGVSLLGIDSVMCPKPRRLEAWNRLGSELPIESLDALTETAVLADLPRLAREVLEGKLRGRVVVDVNG